MHTTDVAHQLQLQRKHFICSNVGGIRAYLLRQRHTRLQVGEDNATITCPLLQYIFFAHSFRNSIFREYKHAFCACAHNKINQGYKAVDITLLVYDALLERINLAIYEAAHIYSERVATVSERTATLIQDITARTHITYIPIYVIVFFAGDFRLLWVKTICFNLLIALFYHRVNGSFVFVWVNVQRLLILIMHQP